MDKSARYIDMCRKAREIQNAHPQFIEGDYVEIGDYPYTVVIAHESDELGLITRDSVSVWLPSQAQLQKLLGKERNVDAWYSFAKYMRYTIVNSDDPEDIPSFEQLWLALVMKEKFKKIWVVDKWGNGKWVSIKEEEK